MSDNKILLCFSKPVPLACLENVPGSHEPGIYIWGFSYDGRFIPHYVGKHETNIHSRIVTHFFGITNTVKYALFSHDFYKNLAENHKLIQRKAQPYRHKFKINEDMLLRYGQEWKHGKRGKDEWIEIQKEFFNEGHFYVSFAVARYKGRQLELCETAVKFNLKYNVISRSQSPGVLKDDTIAITSHQDILKECFCQEGDVGNPPEAYKCYYKPYPGC